MFKETPQILKTQRIDSIASNIEQVLATTPHKAPTIRSRASHPEHYLS